MKFKSGLAGKEKARRFNFILGKPEGIFLVKHDIYFN